VLISGLLTKDGGHPETAIFNRRRLRQDFFTIDAFDNYVIAQHIHKR
jgi:hypothetical protein